jgi:hypothetical protein
MAWRRLSSRRVERKRLSPDVRAIKLFTANGERLLLAVR